MRKQGIEVDTFTLEDFRECPDRYKGENINEILNHFVWGMFWVDGENQPYYYQRRCMRNCAGSGNIIKLGEGAFGLQIPCHHDDMAQLGSPCNTYGYKGDYIGHECKDPVMKIYYNPDDIYVKEGDFLEFHGKPFPHMMFAHKDSPIGDAYPLLHMQIEGTYEGKHIKGLACHDWTLRECNLTQSVNVGEEPEELYYTIAAMSGIREDGRVEHLYATIGFGPHEAKNGFGTGYYCLEGEEPVISTEIYCDAIWERPEYLPEGDPSVAYKDSVWSIGPVKIHHHGEWGCKGHTPKPRFETIGFTHNGYGDWYAGDVPYKHTYYHTLMENIGATIKTCKRAGFKVKE